MSAICREWRIQRYNLLPLLALVAGGFVLGRLFALVIGLISHESGWIPLGVIFAGFGLIAVFFSLSMQFTLGLNHAILMSRTRKAFLIGNYPIGALTLLLGMALTLLLGWLEYITAPAADPQLLDLFGRIAAVVLHPLFLIGFPVGGIIIADFVGALAARFGSRALWVLWGLWMLFAVVFPRLIDASAGRDTLFTRAIHALGMLFGRLSLAMLSVIGLLFLAAALIATIKITSQKRAEA